MKTKTARLQVDLKTFSRLILPDEELISKDYVFQINCGLNNKVKDYFIRDIYLDHEKYTILVETDILNEFIRLGKISSYDDWINKIEEDNIVLYEMTGFKLLEFKYSISDKNSFYYDFLFNFNYEDINNINEDTIPEEFKCPLSLQLMYDPVTLSDGRTYEREVITNWVLKNKSSPFTREEIIYSIKTFRTDWDKRMEIFDYLDKNPCYEMFQYKNTNKINFEHLIYLIETDKVDKFKRYVSNKLHLLEYELESNYYEDRFKRIIFYAIKNIEIFRYLCELGVDLDIPSGYSETYPIHLLFNNENNFIPNIDNFFGYTENEIKEFINIVYQYNFDINIPKGNGNTLLHLSLMNQYKNVFYHLVNLGADLLVLNMYDVSILYTAVQFNMFDITRYLLEEKNCIELINIRNINNVHLISYAMINFDFEKFKYLINKMDEGFNIRYGIILLEIAFTNNKFAHVKYLVEELNVPIEDKYSNILFGIKFNTSLKIIKYIVNKGVDVNKQSEEGLRPLHFAIYVNNIESIVYLINRGALLNKSVEIENININTLKRLWSNPNIPLDKKLFVSNSLAYPIN